MWNVLGHLDPLLTFLFLAYVMCSKYYRHFLTRPDKQGNKQCKNIKLYLSMNTLKENTHDKNTNDNIKSVAQ